MVDVGNLINEYPILALLDCKDDEEEAPNVPSEEEDNQVVAPTASVSSNNYVASQLEAEEVHIHIQDKMINKGQAVSMPGNAGYEPNTENEASTKNSNGTIFETSSKVSSSTDPVSNTSDVAKEMANIDMQNKDPNIVLLSMPLSMSPIVFFLANLSVLPRQLPGW